MFATGLIVFRETLEAALFVSIIAAATKGTHRRGLWISGGVVTGFVGSLCIAALMGTISAWADGIGQDVLNVVIISIALALLTWHCVWVSTHGKQMAEEAMRLGSNVAKGSKPLWALSIAVALSVLREGAETVLFVAGFSSGSSESSSAMQIGMISGLVAAILVGFLIYLGLAKIKPRYLFSVTNSLIILLAGSLASQLAKAQIRPDEFLSAESR
jgi:high-affinity iron transporter